MAELVRKPKTRYDHWGCNSKQVSGWATRWYRGRGQ